MNERAPMPESAGRWTAGRQKAEPAPPQPPRVVRKGPARSNPDDAEQAWSRLQTEGAQARARRSAESGVVSREQAEREIESLGQQWDRLDALAKECAIVVDSGLYKDKLSGRYVDGVSTAFGDAVRTETGRNSYLPADVAANLVIIKGRAEVQRRAKELAAAGHDVPEFTLSRAEQKKQDEVMAIVNGGRATGTVAEAK